MTRSELIHTIKSKKSCLSVGLDVDKDRIPEFLKRESKDPVFEFNKQIIDSTHDICVCYKLNIAFYEAFGAEGWTSLSRTLDYIPSDIFTIADAKRGDIGNTSRMYAQAFFEQYNFDAITVAPYMGADSVQPFLEFDDKWVVLLALTSNRGSQDFQYFSNEANELLYQKVISTSQTWGDSGQMMYVVGATHPQELREIRASLPHHFLLIPGVGAQGGTVEEVMQAASVNGDCNLLINSSRGIIYAGDDRNFPEKARKSALELQSEMVRFL